MPPDMRELLLKRFVAERSALLGFLRFLLPPDLAEDACQEVFLVVDRKLSTFDTARDFGAWVRGIARNVARQVAASRGRLQCLPDEALIDRCDQAFAEAAAEADPLAQDLVHLRTCLEQLDATQRELLRRRYHEGWSLAQLSEGMDRAAGAVQVALSRLRAVLLSCIQKTRRRQA